MDINEILESDIFWELFSIVGGILFFILYTLALNWASQSDIQVVGTGLNFPF